MKQDIATLILRLGVGGMMFSHGLPKVFKFSEMSASFPDPLGVGSTVSFILCVFAEALCSAAVVLGVFTRWAAIPLIINMFVIVFIVHGADPWMKKEFGMLYLVPFLSLAFSGGGKFSLDSLLKIK